MATVTGTYGLSEALLSAIRGGVSVSMTQNPSDTDGLILCCSSKSDTLSGNLTRILKGTDFDTSAGTAINIDTILTAMAQSISNVV